MKKFIYLIAIFAFVTLNSIATNSLYFEEDVVVSISQNDLIKTNNENIKKISSNFYN